MAIENYIFKITLAQLKWRGVATPRVLVSILFLPLTSLLHTSSTAPPHLETPQAGATIFQIRI